MAFTSTSICVCLYMLTHTLTPSYTTEKKTIIKNSVVMIAQVWDLRTQEC